MDWKKYLEQLLWDYRSRKFLLAVGFMVLSVLNYTEVRGVGNFGIPAEVLLLVALVSSIFIWIEGQADIEERGKNG